MKDAEGNYPVRFLRECPLVRAVAGTEKYIPRGVADMLVNERRPPFAEFVDPSDNPRFQRQKALGLGPLVQAVMRKSKRA